MKDTVLETVARVHLPTKTLKHESEFSLTRRKFGTRPVRCEPIQIVNVTFACQFIQISPYQSRFRLFIPNKANWYSPLVSPNVSTSLSIISVLLIAKKSSLEYKSTGIIPTIYFKYLFLYRFIFNFVHVCLYTACV